MKKIFGILILFVCLPVKADITHEYIMTIQVEPSKPNGKSWDRFGGKPDIMLVVENMRYTSVACKNTYRCEMKFTSNAQKWYIEIYDKDLSLHDLIGNGECQLSQNTCTLGQAKVTIR